MIKEAMCFFTLTNRCIQSDTTSAVQAMVTYDLVKEPKRFAKGQGNTSID